MRAALVTGRRSIEHREFPEPQPSPGRAVVQIGYCGICGTDLEPWLSGEPYNPAICGHEWMGEVSAVPADVKHVREGDRVGIGIAGACGRCDACRAGHSAYCEPAFAGLVGMGPLAAPHGGFAPAIAIDAGRIYRVQDGVSDEAAAMLEPATVALHAIRRAQLPVGAGCVVLGAGPIGLLTLQCALAAGAGAVLVIEPHPARRRKALELGACAALDPSSPASEASPGEASGEALAEGVRAVFGAVGPDVVFDCAGLPSTIQQSADLVRRGGVVSLVGLSAHPAQIQPGAWLAREVTMVASLAYLPEEFEVTMGLVQDGRLRCEPLLTSRAPLDGIQDAFERLHSSPEEIKILVRPRTGG